MDEPEDDDLKRAIAMSLESDGKKSSNQASLVDLTEDLEPPNPQEASVTPKMPGGIAGIPNLDRILMERDRLDRLKRKASISPPPFRNGSRTNAQKAPRIEPTPGLREDPPSSSGLRYPQGTVKKTWAFGFEREEDIKIEEVLQKRDLKIAVLSSFQLDFDWLLTKLDPGRNKIMLIMQAKDESTRKQYQAETRGYKNLRLCFPPMEGNVHCMHSKLQLLFYDDHLRIAVPTANLVPFDWGEGGSFMENSVFLIDLPRLVSAKEVPPGGTEGLTFFGKELIYFLEAMRVPEDVITGVLKFDFEATKPLAFVHTIGGSHWGAKWQRTGYCGLGRAVKQLGLAYAGPVNVDFVTSSIGALNDSMMEALYLAAQGDDGLTEYEWRTAPSKRKKAASAAKERDEGMAEAELLSFIGDRMRIYFPSKETVVTSRTGPMGVGTICLQSRWFNGPKFPRHLFRDCISTRSKMLMHNKILFVRPAPHAEGHEDPMPPPWAYVGSANMSESAWGRLVCDGTTKKPRLNCRNWECGVIIPTGSSRQNTDKLARSNGQGGQGMEAFKGYVPVPMQVPGPQYGDKVPWYSTEQDRYLDLSHHFG